ncbi:hypothetical protein F5Y17DRAFT_463704 [Xylariaceae sp. FL0594]|nr:hypothetical protein F5Y17DRAFT_463704 [Xylariaceae sp. FL0594]
MDGDIAIVGVSYQLPQQATDEKGLWEVLESGRNVMTEWPESRVNIDGFYDQDLVQSNKVHSRGGHFSRQDPALFDAPFFSVTANDAAAMDPQHRMTLEASYRAFENAGMTLETIRGSNTAVFAASSSDDYYKMTMKDPDSIPRLTINGTALSMLANRISWYFDLLGPSVHIDTACSGSLVALHLACQSLRTKEASMALVAGANLLLGPEGSVSLANGNYLSPDSLCYSFDSRANGYSRGEGIIALVIKPVLNAVRDGDMIRAVIRATGSNQNGRTAIMTQPSARAQEMLIRDVYNQAGLGFESTRYVEAHGTGTAVGDPAEMTAVGRVFGSYRSADEPLYIGSIKSNIGHLEGSSGLAGVMKALLVLERGIIPPNAVFEKLNPSIEAEHFHLQVPVDCVPWPVEGLRRISVNSFGFGGSNAHVVMDDAFHYLRNQGLNGSHATVAQPIRPEPTPGVSDKDGENETRGIPENEVTSGVFTPQMETNHRSSGISESPPTPEVHVNQGSDTRSFSEPSNPNIFQRLLVWTAADEETLKILVKRCETYCQTHIKHDQDKLRKFAFTLAARRSAMLWRTFAVVSPSLMENGSYDVAPFKIQAAKATRAMTETRVAFVFTGQGTQYMGMGLELLRYPVFEQALGQVDNVLHDLGCCWSVIDKLKSKEDIDRPKYSQPLCTAVQLGLVELLKSFHVVPRRVMGHSSGEIASAYASGALSFASACKIAYFRGQVAENMKQSTTVPGAMLSVNISSLDVPNKLDSILGPSSAGEVHVACINSPYNTTLSGAEETLNIIKQALDREGIFAQKLNTGVPYHSPSMQTVAVEYAGLIGDIHCHVDKTQGGEFIPMVSSVSGQVVDPSLLSEAQYWMDNLISPVRFSDALATLASEQWKLGINANSITDLIEIGPHPALRRPIRDTLSHLKSTKKPARYHASLQKSKSGLRSIWELMGQLFCNGVPVSITSVNEAGEASENNKQPFCVDCPEYPFNHSTAYWREPRLSRDYRLRKSAPRDSLGAPHHDWNPLEPRWRRFISAESTPWTRDHVVRDSFLYPGTGMIVMAIEAVKQTCPASRRIIGFNIEQAHFLNPLVVGETDEESTETIVHLRHVQAAHEKESLWSDVKIMTQSGGHWTECFQARIQVQYDQNVLTEVDGGLEFTLWKEDIRKAAQEKAASCIDAIDRLAFYEKCAKGGISYGETFQLLDNICWDGHTAATGHINTTMAVNKTSDSLVHPAVLDCCLQILVAPVTRGLADDLLTMVPTHLYDIWISAEGWKSSENPFVQVVAESFGNARSGTFEAAIHVVAADRSPLCSMGKVIMAPIAGVSPATDTKIKHLHTIRWKPQLSMMSRCQLQEYMEAGWTRPDTAALVKFRQVLEPTLNRVLFETLCSISDRDRAMIQGPFRKYLQWMEHHVAKTSSSGTASENMTLYGRAVPLRDLAALYPSWEIYPAIAQDLKPILLGKKDPLSVAFETGLAEAFYADVFDRACDGRVKMLFDLLSHENPTMRILEVGAGTGGITKHILTALRELEQSGGGVKFAEYTFTDVSASFLQNAQTKFQEFASRMEFKTLDLDKSPSEQGFQERSYDLVIAGCVLHATKDLRTTLRNIRSVLHPKGRLVCLEVVIPENVITNFAFGVLPGWWSSVEEYRDLSPTITEHQWDLVLQESGFSGNDLTLRDDADATQHIFSTMVSTRCELPDYEAPDLGKLVLIMSPLDVKASQLANSIRSLYPNREAVVFSLQLVDYSQLGADDIVISLLEVTEPLLSTLADPDYQAIKTLLLRANNLVWVTSVSPHDPRRPDYGVALGLLRTIRSENIEKRIINLSMETSLSTEDQMAEAGFVAMVLDATFESGSKEVEYVVRDGQVLTGRLAEEKELNDKLTSLVQPELSYETWKGGPPVRLITRTQGFLESLEFVEEDDSGDLGPYEIEIESKAWALNFRDVFVALGRLPGDGLGFDCAGIVTRVGSACDATIIRPGDRVCGCSSGCMRTYPRFLATEMVKIPPGLSFETAVSAISPLMTAHHCLLAVARLRREDKILIHSASGTTGQMAIRIAQMVGAEIFGTVGLDEKKQLLVDKFGIPADHIFYSRDTSFARGIKRVTKNYGVDVVLNSLTGDNLRASWECLAPFGRFIEIGKTDIEANAGLPMAGFRGNITFTAVDIHHMWLSNPRLAEKLFKDSMELFFSGVIEQPYPLNIYATSELEQAFRYLQNGKSSGRIIIRVGDDDIVPKRVLKRSAWKFDSNASYLIAGGLGGLGRGISKWMVDRGAKNLILLSRSGPTSPPAVHLVKSLRERGVTVAAPKCDVGSQASLSAALEECKAMPPIKGCINAAMSLNDSLLTNMTHAQWHDTISSKVQSSWNLHHLLPLSLDFFILLSSLSGIYGSISQANYSAGCRFQDALAHYRVAQGQKAISLDLGWIRNIGIVAETADYLQNRLVLYNMMPIEDTELMALLDLSCDPATVIDHTQLLIGPVTPASSIKRGLEPSPLAQRPLFSPFSIVVGDERRVEGSNASYASLFISASGLEERVEVVVQALAAKLARAMSISCDDVEPSRHLSDYGVDSLMAIELRNWISKDFGANLAVFDIMGAATIQDIGHLVSERAQWPTSKTEKPTIGDEDAVNQL